MATSQKTSTLATGQDAASQEANLKYEDALAKLTTALDSRQNQMFDPTMLAAAQGFLTPSRSGSFGESLGNVSGLVGKAQQAQNLEDQDIAKQRLELAGMGVQRQQAKSNAAAGQEYLASLGVGQPQEAAAPVAGLPALPPTAGALTEKGPKPVPAVPEAAFRPLGEAIQPQQIPQAPALGALQEARPVPAPQTPAFKPEMPSMMQVAPPNPYIANPLAMAKLMIAQGANPADVAKQVSEMASKESEVTQGKLFNSRTGMGTMLPTGETVDTTVFGYPGSRKVNISDAAQLSYLARTNQPDKYAELAKRVVEGPVFAGKETQVPASQEEKAIEQKSQETRATDLAKASAAKEANLEENTANARRIYSSASRVEKSLKESPNFFGLFNRPDAMSAIGKFVNEGVQTPLGSLKFGGLEEAITQMMPGVKGTDLKNVKSAAADLAEIELGFTKMYLAKQGAVTEGERKIVRAIPGTVSDSPEFLKTRMQLLKSRSQFDIDVADAFRTFQDKNPGRSYLDFERKSDQYRSIIKDFEKETARLADAMPAMSTRERKEEAATGKPNLSGARQRLNQLLGQ